MIATFADHKKNRLLAALPEAEWDRVLAINLRGPIGLTQKLVPAMAANDATASVTPMLCRS